MLRTLKNVTYSTLALALGIKKSYRWASSIPSRCRNQSIISILELKKIDGTVMCVPLAWINNPRINAIIFFMWVEFFVTLLVFQAFLPDPEINLLL